MKKLLIIITSIVLIFTICFIAWLNYVPTKITYLSEIAVDDTAINWNDSREVVGVSDYVFVAYVEEIYDYNSEKFTRDFPEIIDYNSTVYTECKVKVISNIKGCLEVGTEFSLYKWGGITWLRTSYLLHDNDKVPETDQYYIFAGECYPDGTMLVGGAEQTIKLGDGIDSTNFEQSKTYQKYVEAYENQITTHSDNYHYLCTADADYGDGTYNAEIFSTYLDWKKEKGSDIDKAYYKVLKDGNPKIK